MRKVKRNIGYQSLDQTAIDFAKTYYRYTYSTGRECGANLYSEIVTGRTQYFYDDFRCGSEYFVFLPMPNITETSWRIGARTYVGNLHTHPCGHKCNNRFSGYDISVFRSLLSMKPDGFIFEAYLVTQEEKVLKYDPKTNAEIFVAKFTM